MKEAHPSFDQLRMTLFSIKMSKEETIASYDPSGVGVANNRIFGLPFSFEEAAVILFPVPWEVTVSYNAGTASGPHAILNASPQLDLYDPDLKDAWKLGIFMHEVSNDWLYKNDRLREKSGRIIEALEEGESIESLQVYIDEINKGCEDMNAWVKKSTSELLKQGKLVGLVGGDHSTPLGFIQTLAENHTEFGILQIDAHCDLRDAYEGFKYSHASVMFNALKIEQIKKLVQVGIRDCSPQEVELINANPGRIKTYFDADIKNAQFEGKSWSKITGEIINELPQNVYISFDIDGLDPVLCPHTGTPVPGGFNIHEVFYLIIKLVESGRKIIGFDLVEVAPDETDWDGNVGARVLYKLSNMMAKSNGAMVP